MTSLGLPPDDIQQRNALALEERKWSFKREELKYLEAGQHLRALNQLMWQVPSLAIAITGGLWYGATLIDNEITRRFLLAFSVTMDVLTIVTLWRLRMIIGMHINRQRTFEGSPALPGNYTVITCWSIALVMAAIGGAMGVWSPALYDKTAVGSNTNTGCSSSSHHLFQMPPAA